MHSSKQVQFPTVFMRNLERIVSQFNPVITLRCYLFNSSYAVTLHLCHNLPVGFFLHVQEV